MRALLNVTKSTPLAVAQDITDNQDNVEQDKDSLVRVSIDGEYVMSVAKTERGVLLTNPKQ